MASNQQLSEDQIDDLLYCARAGDLDELRETVDALVPPDQSSDKEQERRRTLAQLLESASNEDGNTPLHYCCANGHLETAKYLLPFCSLPVLLAQNASGNTPLHWAGLNGHLDIVKALIDRINEAESQDPELARTMNRIEPRASAANGASKGGDSEKGAGDAQEVEDEDAAEDREAQERRLWDMRNKAGRGPMSEAQMAEREEVVKYLLERMIGGAAPTEASTAEAGRGELKETPAPYAGKDVQEVASKTEALELGPDRGADATGA